MLIWAQVSRLFNVQLSRVRNLYIIPFLSGSATVPSPFNSLISSAPITCTPCRLKILIFKLEGKIYLLNHKILIINFTITMH